MRTIYKYPVPIDDTVVIRMPEFARPLAVAEQRGSLCLWAEVDVEREMVGHTFHVRGTGHPMQGNEGKYLGTVVMSYGLVWHMFATALLARERADA